MPVLTQAHGAAGRSQGRGFLGISVFTGIRVGQEVIEVFHVGAYAPDFPVRLRCRIHSIKGQSIMAKATSSRPAQIGRV